MAKKGLSVVVSTGRADVVQPLINDALARNGYSIVDLGQATAFVAVCGTYPTWEREALPGADSVEEMAERAVERGIPIIFLLEQQVVEAINKVNNRPAETPFEASLAHIRRAVRLGSVLVFRSTAEISAKLNDAFTELLTGHPTPNRQVAKEGAVLAVVARDSQRQRIAKAAQAVVENHSPVKGPELWIGIIDLFDAAEPVLVAHVIGAVQSCREAVLRGARRILLVHETMQGAFQSTSDPRVTPMARSAVAELVSSAAVRIFGTSLADIEAQVARALDQAPDQAAFQTDGAGGLPLQSPIPPIPDPMEKPPITGSPRGADYAPRDWARANLQAIADEPISGSGADAFAFGDLADSISAMAMSNKTQLPLVFALTGPWGAGKSSLGTLIEERLGVPRPAGRTFPDTIVKFNAWLYSDAEHLHGALLSSVARQLHKKVPIRAFGLPTRFLTPRERVARLVLYTVLFSGIAFALTQSAGHGWFNLALFGTAISGILLALPELFSMLSRVGDFVARPSVQAASGSLEETRRQWSRFVARRLAPGSRLHVFIEDLDRCSAQQALSVLECTNQVLQGPQTTVFLLCDMHVLAQQVGYLRQQDHGGDSSPEACVKEGLHFVQKVVGIRVEIPRGTPTSINNFVTTLSSDVAESVPERSRFRGVFTKEKASWQRAIWSPGILPTNPFLRLGHFPWSRIWEVWLAELTVLAQRSVLFVRRAIVPSAIRNKFGSPGRVMPFLGRLALFYVVSTAWVVMLALPLILAPNPAVRLPASMLFAIASVMAQLLLLFPALAILIGAFLGLLLRMGISRIRSTNPAEPTPVGILKARRIELRITESIEVLDKIDATDTMAEAFEKASEFLNVQPRLVKRIVNRLRLEINFCISKGVLGSRSSVSPAMVGKWVVFMERWPQHYQAVLEDQSKMQKLEAEPPEELGSDLRRFLESRPYLGDHISNLVSYSTVLSRET